MPHRRALLAAAALTPVLASSLGAPRRTGAQVATPGAAQGAMQMQPNVAYGEAGGEELFLDAYGPPRRETPRPAVLLFHGGAWTEGWGSRTEMLGAAVVLATAGYAAFAVGYRLLDGSADHRWPAQLDDAQRAVRWVRAHAAEYGVDPARVAAYGYSAGGQLAALLGVRETRDNGDAELTDYSSRVDCVVAISGSLDLAPLLDDEVYAREIVAYLGGTAEEQPEAYRDASALFWVDAEASPFLIVHGGGDDAILAEQSRQLAAALDEAGVEVVHVAIPRIDHLGTDEWALGGPLMLAFLATQLHPEQ